MTRRSSLVRMVLRRTACSPTALAGTSVRAAGRCSTGLLLGVILILVAWSGGGRAIAAEGTVVSGTVSGSDQGFLKGASVVLEGARRRETVTDADGRFTFADVSAGQYRVKVTADAYLPIDQPMQVGTASISVDIVLLRLPGIP
jgi:hypothetical protein